MLRPLLSWCQEVSGAKDQVSCYCQTVWRLFMRSALSEERTSLSFTTAAAPSQCSHIYRGSNDWISHKYYKKSFRTSQETHYVSAAKANRLMHFRGKYRCVLWERRETHKYTLWAQWCVKHDGCWAKIRRFWGQWLSQDNFKFLRKISIRRYYLAVTRGSASDPGYQVMTERGDSWKSWGWR
jgi:hypothetical protein